MAVQSETGMVMEKETAAQTGIVTVMETAAQMGTGMVMEMAPVRSIRQRSGSL